MPGHNSFPGMGLSRELKLFQGESVVFFFWIQRTVFKDDILIAS